MPTLQNMLELFKNRRPLLNIILDGYGIGKHDFTDGIYLSKPPMLKDFFQKRPHCQLLTHGPWVGLSGDHDMGGSEVGHLTIGAGQILKQGSSLIKEMIADKSLFKQEVLQKIYAQALHNSLHLIGLLSDGNIHSHIDHFIAIITEAAKQKVPRCYIHALLDGRDTPIQSALDYIEQLQTLLSEINRSNSGFDYRIVSGGGRETMTMDRDKRWDRVELGWRTHVQGLSGNNFRSAQEAVKHFRTIDAQIIDQDLPAFNVVDNKGATTTIKDNDAVLFMNFRGDRAIEISQAFENKEFPYFDRGKCPKVYYAGMMVYDQDSNLPANVMIKMPPVQNPFGKRILEMGLKQFRLAESQKFPHVTFFFNGGYRLPLDPAKETYFLVDSDKSVPFDQRPQMKAMEVAQQAVKFIEQKEYDYGLVNFANPDMVGHTGSIEAVKIAINTVDKALGLILKKIDEVGGLAVVTADHGNADEMIVYNKKKNDYEPSTKHSLNPVPYAIYDPLFKKGDYSLTSLISSKQAGLANIAATNFILLGQKPPSDIADPLINY